jgi:GNAT superfamily N-acetyltransferase
MLEDIVIKMMSRPALWRCIYRGPLKLDILEAPPVRDKKMDWPRFHARNAPLIEELTTLYGSCAVVAMDGDAIVGMLRFYPKAICQKPEAGFMCLQQEYPAGPADDLVKTEFPTVDKIRDRTLGVHCMMTGDPSQKELPYQRKGIGTRMVKELIEWAGQNGWTAIEATAYEDLPWIYKYTGAAGKAFWEKLDFKVIQVGVEPEFEKEHDFVVTLRKEAEAKGLDPMSIRNKYTMRLELSK